MSHLNNASDGHDYSERDSFNETMRTKYTIIKTPRHFYLFVEVFMNQWPSVKTLINIKGGEWLLCGECGSQNKQIFLGEGHQRYALFQHD